jgi:hypothetical protein
MSDVAPFRPTYTNTSIAQTGGGAATTNAGTLVASVTLAATASAQPVTLPAPGGDSQIQIANQGTTWAFVNFGVAGNVTAATVAASYPIGPGAVVVVSVAPEVSGASCILASSTGNVTFTRGSGT